MFPDASQGGVPVYRGYDQYGHHVFSLSASMPSGFTSEAGVKFYIVHH